MQINTILFCKGRRCCPEVQIKNDGTVIIGGKDEGFTTFSKENFHDFVSAAKEGKIDAVI